jgi:hypothetical protein
MITRLKGIFTDIEVLTDNSSPTMARSLRRFFHELCEEQPGVVSVRNSFESFEALTPLADEDADNMSIVGQSDYVTEDDSDSLTVSDGESVVST